MWGMGRRLLLRGVMCRCTQYSVRAYTDDVLAVVVKRAMIAMPQA